MAGALAGAGISGLFQLGQSVNQGSEDRNFRNGWTQSQLGQLSSNPTNAGKNIMIVYPDHDASQLVNSKQSQLLCVCPNSGITMSYECYIFDSGPFTLKGDGGYLNWAFCGNFTRDKNNVNFSKLG